MSKNDDMLLMVLRRVLVERQINVSLNVLKILDREVKSELTGIPFLPRR